MCILVGLGVTSLSFLFRLNDGDLQMKNSFKSNFSALHAQRFQLLRNLRITWISLCLLLYLYPCPCLCPSLVLYPCQAFFDLYLCPCLLHPYHAHPSPFLWVFQSFSFLGYSDLVLLACKIIMFMFIY